MLCTAIFSLSSVMGASRAVAAAASPRPASTEPAPDSAMVQAPAQPHPLDHGARTELLELRTADSRTFRNADGTYTSDYFTAPAFFRDASGAFVPIEAVPVAGKSEGIAYETKAGPVMVRFSDSSTATALVTLNGGEGVVRFAAKLPAALAGVPTPRTVAPNSDGQHVTYPDVYPGVDLRYSLLSSGVKEDIVLTEPGGPSTFAFVIDAGSLQAALETDGSISLSAADGVAYRLPAPFMVDSAPERDGDGARSGNVAYRLTEVAGATVLVVEADPKWLAADERVYPVYIDPTFTTSLDTFISQGYPSYNLNAQWNPNEGGYYELWNGQFDPGSGTNYAFVKTGIPSAVTVYSATFKIYVQHSASLATPTGIQLARLTSAFTESQTWNMTHPTYVAVTSTTVADNQWASFNVLSTVQSWVEGTATNYGFRIYEASTNQSLWKRLRAQWLMQTYHFPISVIWIACLKFNYNC